MVQIQQLLFYCLLWSGLDTFSLVDSSFSLLWRWKSRKHWRWGRWSMCLESLGEVAGSLLSKKWNLLLALPPPHQHWKRDAIPPCRDLSPQPRKWDMMTLHLHLWTISPHPARQRQAYHALFLYDGSFIIWWRHRMTIYVIGNLFNPNTFKLCWILMPRESL